MSSKRLDSISRPTHKLKFKPKVVARKTKEERDNEHVLTPGVNRKARQPRKFMPKQNRVNRKYQNTTLVSAGPLSAGAVSMGVTQGRTRMKSESSLVAKLRRTGPKREGSSLGENYGEVAEDDGDLRVDMGKPLSEDKEASLYPVRAERVQHYEYGEEPKDEKKVKTESREGTVETVSSVSRDPSEAPQIDTAGDAVLDYQSEQEQKRVKKEYETLVKFMKEMKVDGKSENEFKVKPEPGTEEEALKASTSTRGLPSKYLFLQLPPTLPEFEGQERLPKGVVGSLRYHKSGKVSIKIGDVVFDVRSGGSATFGQEIIGVNKANRQCYHLGSVGEKIIATPKI